MKPHEPEIAILHGVNVVNAGDLGIIHATVQRLRQEMPSGKISIISPFVGYKNAWAEKHKHARTVDVTTWGAEEVPDFYRVPISGFANKAKFVLQFIFLTLLAEIDTRFFRKAISKRHSKLKHYATADIFVSKGGGFLHDHTGTSSIPPHLFSMLLALRFRKPLVIYAQSIGPFNGRLGAWVTRYVLNRASLLLIREKVSIDYMQKTLGVSNPNLIETADEAFMLEPASNERVQQILSAEGVSSEKTLVGVAVCNWGFPNSGDPAADKKRYIRETASAIDQLVAHHSADVLIASHVEIDGVIDDRAIAKKVYELVKEKARVHVLGTYDDAEIKGIWGNCDLFVGTRMHSNIFALASGVPTIAISYLHKTTGIMKGLGLSEWVLEIDNFTAQEIVGKADLILNQGLLTKDTVNEKVERIRNIAHNNAVLVRELLG